MEYFNIRSEANYPIVKLGIQLKKENQPKIVELFAKLLNKNEKWFKFDFDTYYHSRINLDKLIVKINKRHKIEFREATINILTQLGCSDFKLEEEKFNQYYICNTPFGERKIEILKFSVDADVDGIFHDFTVGIRLTGRKEATVLDFKENAGGLENIIEEDYTKHFQMIHFEIYKILPLLSNLEIKIVNGR